MDDKTGLFDVSVVKKKLIASTLDEVFSALKERGYNPVNQIVGDLISGDPGYISNYKDARKKLMDFDRAEIVAIILQEYLDKCSVASWL